METSEALDPSLDAVKKLLDIKALTKELDRLEKICGTRLLADIFFEIQDKGNAVTDYSSRYPRERAALEKLYNDYGFDVLYEELEL